MASSDLKSDISIILSPMGHISKYGNMDKKGVIPEGITPITTAIQVTSP
jgi:hypothetical protein